MKRLLGFFPKVHLGTVALNFALCRPPPCIGTLVVVVLVSLVGDCMLMCMLIVYIILMT